MPAHTISLGPLGERSSGRPRLVNVHVEDTKCGVREHLMFGEGEIDFPPVLQALRDIRFSGGIHVELSRHSHMAPDAARRTYDFLTPLIQ